jgi:extradiol dioxygenase family protein
MNPFHLAFPIKDIEETRAFYANILGCKVGREDKKWIDFDFYGHQLSAHVKPEDCLSAKTNEVDKEQVPVRHFGLVLDWNTWENLANNVRKNGLKFHIEPDIRFKGQVGEQGTFFIFDPSGNALEFKTFKNLENLFKS